MASKTAQTRYNHYVMIASKIQSFGCDMKEPELAAATGLTEDQVYHACKMALKNNWLVLQFNGAYLCVLNKTFRMESVAA